MNAAAEGLLGAAAWLDAEPARYATLAWLCLGATVLAAFAPGAARRGWASPWLFAAGVVLTLCAFRWPTWFVPHELNPDESQMISGAQTLRHFPVYWKYVDGTTHGPLDDYFLVLLSWLGVPLNYAGARIGAALLEAGALLGLWGALRRVAPERPARLGVLPALAFWSLTAWSDYVHYSSELVPVCLLSLAVWLLAEALTAAPLTALRVRLALGGAGLALGAIPFGKLQVTPLAAAVGLCALAVLWRRRNEAGVKPAALLLVGGACAVPALIGGCLAIYGLIPQFWGAYITSNLAYVDSKPHGLGDMLLVFFSFITPGGSFAWFFLGGVAYALLQVQRTIGAAGGPLRTAMLAGWLLTAVAFLSVILPGRELGHYLHLLVLPVSLLAATHLAAAAGLQEKSGRSLLPVWLVFGALTLAPQAWQRIHGLHEYLGHLAEYRAQPPLPASRYLLARARPGDQLAMWGWQAQVYVETGLVQGTRDAHSAYQLNHTPLREFYRDRYMRDMSRRRPAWFVDAVGPEGFGYQDRTIDGHETFPALAAFIRENYDYVGEEGGLRIYRLRPPR
jgi:hypothetical protein